MRYQSAVVLSTLAIGHAAATNIRHANFHARRQAEAKRDIRDVDWNAAVANVDWSTLNWDSIMAPSTPGAAAAATPAPAQPSAEAPVSSSVQGALTSAAAAPEPTSDNARTPTSADAPKVTSSSSGPGDLNTGVFKAIMELFGPKNDVSANVAWTGGQDSKWKGTIINDADEDAVVFCWPGEVAGFLANATVDSIAVAGGASVDVNFAGNVGMACSFAYSETRTDATYGFIANPWLEMNFGDWTTFDVSREPAMNGNVVTMKGSKCTSGVSGGQLSCLFACTDKAKSNCKEAGTYAIVGAGSDGTNGCMVGVAGDGGASGGCQGGSDGEHIEITLYNNKNWPA